MNQHRRRDRFSRRKGVPKWFAAFGEIVTPMVLIFLFLGVLLVLYFVAL